MRYPQTIMVSCEIPWDEDEELIEDVFREEIRATLNNGYNYLYTFGTAGEGYAVTSTQFKEIVEIFAEETNKDGVFPNIGIIAMSTAQVVERIGLAYDNGFRVFQIALPPWGALNDDEYMTFFKDVCENFSDAKFLHYNLPRAKRVLLGPEYRLLEAAIPNLVGTKNLRADITEIESIATHTSELQHFWGEYGFPIGCLYGECSLLSSFGGLIPSKTKEFFEYGVTGQVESLFRMMPDIIGFMYAFEEPGLSGQDHIDGAFDKMIVRASGIDMPLRLLSPYHGFDLKTFEASVKNVQEKYPGWF